MNKPAFRWSHPSVIVFGLLLINVIGANASQERRAAGRPASPESLGCRICDLAYDKCFATCFAGLEQGKAGACLKACNDAAVACTCDGEVNVRSEDLVEWGVVSLNKDACHSYVSCQPNYPSCAGWSSETTCGTPYCRNEMPCGEEICDSGFCLPQPGPAYHVPHERFRVCFDQFANPCTEWYRVTYYTCGCP